MKKKNILILIIIIVLGMIFIPGQLDQSGPPNVTPNDQQPIDSDSKPKEDVLSDTFAIRGVIEGFYGEPWTMGQRMKMLEFMSQNHFNTYIYAPKDDPYQRTQWGDLYSDLRLSQMKQLIKSAEKNGIDFVYSISPGIPAPLPGETLTSSMIANSITFTSDSDVQRLRNKLEQLQSIGVQTFMLSFDDVEHSLKPIDEKVYGSDYHLAHIDLANQLLLEEKQKDPKFKLWFAPTDYYGLNDSPYWSGIRSYLESSIQVIWTGSWVLNKEITSDQVQQVTNLIGRKPLIWDNYPVNDYTYVVRKAPQLFMGPLENRSPDLSSYVSGLIANPMIQPESSKISLATIGQYLYNPTSYNSQKAWELALENTEGIVNTAAFQRFCLYSSPSLLNDDINSYFLDLTAQFWQDYQNGQRGASETNLRQELESLSTLPNSLRQTISNKELLTEINPWLNLLGEEGKVALQALDYLYLSVNDPQKSVMENDLESKIQALKSNNLKIGTEILDFISSAIQARK